ncbi:AraC family transcriptional regulator [Escherichia coli]|nr:AraC family transcriptional regulator [Escherichia coli]
MCCTLPLVAGIFHNGKPLLLPLACCLAKQQLGFSVVQWDGKTISKSGEATRRPTRPTHRFFLLQTLNEMQMQPQEQQTARLIVASLLSHCRDLLGSQIQTASRQPGTIRSYSRLYRRTLCLRAYPRICRTGILYFTKLSLAPVSKNGGHWF